jgi:DNA repair protein RadC
MVPNELQARSGGSMFHIKSSSDAEHVMRQVIQKDRVDYKEFFWVILLSRSSHVLGVAEIGSGTTNSVSVNVKEIFQLALKTNASSIIVCHNHPSGSLSPSQADIQITEKLVGASKLLDVELLDHLIITSESSYSFKDESRL